MPNEGKDLYMKGIYIQGGVRNATHVSPNEIGRAAPPRRIDPADINAQRSWIRLKKTDHVSLMIRMDGWSQRLRQAKNFTQSWTRNNVGKRR